MSPSKLGCLSGTSSPVWPLRCAATSRGLSGAGHGVAAVFCFLTLVLLTPLFRGMPHPALVGELGARTGGHGQRSLRQTANNEKAVEKAAQDIGRPVRDQFLVRVDIATALHRRSLRSAESLGIADQHDGERAGRELL